MEIRNGDVVTIRATIDDDVPTQSDFVIIRIAGHGKVITINRSDIVSVEPRRPKVGDEVKDPDGMVRPGKVLAISGEDAWVRYPSKGHDRGYIDVIEKFDCLRVA